MRTTLRSVILVLSGCALGFALVLACGDDTVETADAACDCPAAEPPLAGRVVRVEQTVESDSLAFTAFADCAPGAILLSGSCRIQVEGEQHLNIALQDSGTSSEAGFERRWYCFWEQTGEPIARTVTVTAICLEPAE